MISILTVICIHVRKHPLKVMALCFFYVKHLKHHYVFKYSFLTYVSAIRLINYRFIVKSFKEAIHYIIDTCDKQDDNKVHDDGQTTPE